ncbi:MAG: precorrin-6Y C5,15-methyltransferase (decarboxylating) subunit CbiT [Eubacteriales bacterium]
MSSNIWVYKTGGIPDEMFVRAKIPMTKSEVRAVTVAKARLQDNHIIWDIGAGTGSISVEAALTVTGGKVYAVEKEDEAVDLIKQNTALFGIDNVTVCCGMAPQVLHELPCPDRVFIGGSGGNLVDIIEYVHGKLPIGGRLVINAVVLETLVTAVDMLKKLDFRDIDIAQVNVAKTVDVGRLHMFKSHNPVFVISGEK